MFLTFKLWLFYTMVLGIYIYSLRLILASSTESKKEYKHIIELNSTE